MPDLTNCEYVLVDYAPSPLRDTRIPVGLFLFEASGRLLRQGFAQDWQRVRCLDPGADMAMLAALPGHFERALAAANPHDVLLQMREDFSGGVQISLPKAVRTPDPQREFDLLFQQYIDPPRPVRGRVPEAARPGSRRWIHAQLSDAFRRHALWNVVSREIGVAEFTAPGDGFRIDFAYRPNGVTHYLHAISLERDWNQAKLLSYTFWRIQEKIKAEMTAIVADVPGESEEAASCRQILAGARINIQPLSSLDPYLDGIARQLRLM